MLVFSTGVPIVARQTTVAMRYVPRPSLGDITQLLMTGAAVNGRALAWFLAWS
jgi:hypothetical protein